MKRLLYITLCTLIIVGIWCVYPGLLFGQTENKKSIVAEQGSTFANGEKKSTLSFDRDGLISVAIDDSMDIAPIPDMRRIGDGCVRVGAKEAKNAFLSLVNDDKKIEAAKVVQKNDVIVLMPNHYKDVKAYAKKIDIKIDKREENIIIESARLIEFKAHLNAVPFP